MPAPARVGGGTSTARCCCTGRSQCTYLSMLHQEVVPPSEAYEHSEMLLYRALILEEGGQVQEALAYLDECKVMPSKT